MFLHIFIRRALKQIYEGQYTQNYNSVYVLCGYETWSVTLRDQHRLRVFENRVLRKIFEPKMKEVLGEWRRLRNDDLLDLFFFHGASASSGTGPPLYGGFTNTLRHTTVGRSPLDERSA